MSDSHRHAVAQYYEANTRRFLASGDAGQSMAIHRKLWAPGIDTPEAAAAHINDLVAQATSAALGHAPVTLTDLGCGVGGSLLHLANLWPETRFTGYTLSDTQVQIAQALALQRNLQDRCEVLQADFTSLQAPARSEVVIAIESHTHLSSLDLFLGAASQHVSPGGFLIMVDDMLAGDGSSLTSKDLARIDALKRGWRVGHVPAVNQVVDQAQLHGFELVSKQDLGEFLRLYEPWDRLLSWIAPPLDWLGLDRVPRFANMIGGNALTECHRTGVMRYMMIVLRHIGR